MNGAQNVPLNAQFLIGPRQVDGQTMQLREPDGGVVEEFTLGPTRAFYVPRTLLRPNAEYTLANDNPYQRPVLFRTIDREDHEPPVLEGFTSTLTDIPPTGCARQGVELIEFEPSGHSDDTTPASHLQYALFTGDSVETIDANAPPVLLTWKPYLAGGALCEPELIPLLKTPRLAGALVAIDLAGNQSKPTKGRVLKAPGCATAPGPLAIVLGLFGVFWRPKRTQKAAVHPAASGQ